MSILNEDADGFYLYTVDYVLHADLQPDVFFHPPETWHCVLEHSTNGFRDCPETEELWLGTQTCDEIQLWRRQ